MVVFVQALCISTEVFCTVGGHCAPEDHWHYSALIENFILLLMVMLPAGFLKKCTTGHNQTL